MIGFAKLDSDTLSFVFVASNSSKVPIDLDSIPTFRIYGPDGAYVSGSAGACTEANTGTITAASNATPIVITSASHGLTNNMRLRVRSVGGNTAANGLWKVANVATNTFELSGSNGNGTYTSGGTWHAAGLYAVSVTPTEAAGYTEGTYTIVVSGETGSVSWSQEFRFEVV